MIWKKSRKLEERTKEIKKREKKLKRTKEIKRKKEDL